MTFSATLPNFSSDYQEGAHARVLDALVATNMEQSSGYGTDEHCERARDLIREACQAPDADVYFLVGGTQTNATVIDANQHARGRHRRARRPQDPRHPRR